jgi:hypothetical protein
MRLTERDLYIFEAIHAFDGMLGAQQIRRLRYRDGKPLFKSWRTTRERLSKLYQNGYIDRPDRRQRAALIDMVYWLTERSAALVAGLHGQELDEFRWRRQPRWSMVEHDLAVNDFRLAIVEACGNVPGLELAEWQPAGEFWAYPDEVEYKDEQGKKTKRRIRPDSFFDILHLNGSDGKWYHNRMLLELDRATEDNPRFAREKVRPGVAYLRSQAYERRFGFKSGRWLVVTTGERRMLNMKRQTEATAGGDAGAFYFTMLDQVTPDSVLTEPIWYQGNVDEPVALFT